MFESRAKAIAKAEIAKNTVRLVDRNFYFGSVARDNNCFTGGRRILFDGIVKQIAEIDKADIEMPLNNPDDDSDESPEQKEEDFGGVTQGMTVLSAHGTRFTDIVLIDGFKIDLKIFQDAINLPENPGTPNVQLAQWFDRSANGSLVRQWPEEVVLEYYIIQCWYPAAQQTGSNPADMPTLIELVKSRLWGYNSKLDVLENAEYVWSKKRILAKGVVRYKLTELPIDKTVHRFVKMRNPLKQKFLPRDQNGQQATLFKLFFVLRSNIPTSGPNQPVSYEMFAPRVHLCLTTHYHE